VKRKITIIEDDNDLRGLMQTPLLAAGYDVSMRSEGNSFIYKRESRPHLYLIDVDLGGISGLEICRKIKSRKHGEIPVVIITSANPDVRRLAAEASADGALPKPFTTKELLRKISEYFPVNFGLAQFPMLEIKATT
jgi:two-component system phosphate regulon response regulator PhoB